MGDSWLTVPVVEFEMHMEPESIRQGEMIRRHLAECMRRFKQKLLLWLGAGNG